MLGFIIKSCVANLYKDIELIDSMQGQNGYRSNDIPIEAMLSWGVVLTPIQLPSRLGHC
jgi:hypothetical protein